MPPTISPLPGMPVNLFSLPGMPLSLYAHLYACAHPNHVIVAKMHARVPYLLILHSLPPYTGHPIVRAAHIIPKVVINLTIYLSQPVQRRSKVFMARQHANCLQAYNSTIYCLYSLTFAYTARRLL